uniref:Major facilitator superfamily associated domain-containing protein n=1 Tax=Florenciella parvula TaxID=236787 RepID=A0A7S2FU78_9STRA
MAILCYSTRVVGYTMVPPSHGWLVLILEPLHGITYACSKTALIEFVARETEMGFEATAQGVMQSLTSGVAPLVALPLAGFITDSVGANYLYRGAACMVMVALGLQLAMPYCMRLSGCDNGGIGGIGGESGESGDLHALAELDSTDTAEYGFGDESPMKGGTHGTSTGTAATTRSVPGAAFANSDGGGTSGGGGEGGEGGGGGGGELSSALSRLTAMLPGTGAGPLQGRRSVMSPYRRVAGEGDEF